MNVILIAHFIIGNERWCSVTLMNNAIFHINVYFMRFHHGVNTSKRKIYIKDVP